MARNAFDNSLRLLVATDSRYILAGKPGPLAEGPVADDERMAWIQVWIFQNIGRRAAAATGTSDWSAAPLRRRWSTPTELVKGSSDFLTGEPALATALALVRRGSTSKEFYWWSVPVTIDPPI